MTAVNIDPYNELAWSHSHPSRLVAEGFTGVRFTGRAAVQTRINACKASGLKVLSIVTWESNGYVPWNADIVQIHNEPDVNGNMSPQQWANEFVIYRNTYPQFTMFSAGLASGGQQAIDWMGAALDAIGTRARRPDAIAIHPYTLSPQQAADQFDGMWNAFGIPVVATEWFHSASSMMIWDFQAMLNNPTDGRSTLWNSWFGYTDAMVYPFGLRKSSGDAKDEFYALCSAPDFRG